MRLQLMNYFLTLVLVFKSFSVLAAPPSQLVQEFHKPSEPEEVLISRNYIKSQSTAFLLGTNGTTQIFGIHHSQYTPDEKSWEWGITYWTSQFLGGHLQRKYFCCLGEYFDPYYTWGLGSKWNPQENLATFINYKRYYLLAGGGWEDLFKSRRKWRAEVKASIASEEISLYVIVAFAWGK